MLLDPQQFLQINQPDATVSQVYYLTFMYGSTCFGRLHAHHQELNNCSSRHWFYRWSVVVAVLLVVVGPTGRPAEEANCSEGETQRTQLQTFSLLFKNSISQPDGLCSFFEAIRFLTKRNCKKNMKCDLNTLRRGDADLRF
jgi:hypothetical protein